MLSSMWRPRPGKRRASSNTMRRILFASTSSSVTPPVNRRAAWPLHTVAQSLFSRLPHRLLPVDRGAQARRRHRQVAHAHADRVGDRVGDRRHRWHDRHLADAAGAERVAWVRVLDQNRLDHRQVGGYGHSVIEEARVIEAPVLVVDVFFVERPADTLRHAALDLALDIGGVNGPADILDRRIAQDLDLARLLVDLDVADMRRKAGAGALRVDRQLGADRTAGPSRFECNLGQRQRLEAASVGAGGVGLAVLPFDRVGGDVPDHRGALFQLLDDLLGGLCRGHAGREGDAAAAGQEREADRAGVADDCTDLFDRDTENLGRHHPDRGARAADVRIARHDDGGAVFVDVAGRARLAADVEPEARRDAAALIGSELLLQMRMVLGGIERLGVSDVLPGRAVHGLDAVLRRVLLAQCQWVDAELIGQFVETALDAVGRVRGAGRAIGGDLWAI